METTNIINELLEGEPDKKFTDIFYTTTFERWLLILIVIGIIILIPLYLIDELRPYSIIFIKVALLSILLLLTGSMAIGLLKDIANPTKDCLPYTAIKLERQLFLTQRISFYSSWDIENVLIRINQDIVNLQNRSRLLVGALDKLGIVPALFALYLTTTQNFKGDSSLSVEDTLLGANISFYIIMFIIGVYLGAFLATNIITKYQEFSLALSQAKKLSEEREALNNNNAP